MADNERFLVELEGFYRHAARDLPWRKVGKSGQIDSYHVLVSELMLQQTQVARVIPKYQAFLAAFPTLTQLASSELSEVIKVWVGLGYNRRAKYVRDAAETLQGETRPWSQEMLVTLKGIGANTAAAIVTYSYDEPAVFIETNIRTVIIHHFFRDGTQIADAEIRRKLMTVLPWEIGWKGALRSPRHFYWALMDYGTHLKSTEGNHSRRSRSYAKQSTFLGSRRQVRGALIRQLAAGPKTLDAIRQTLPDERLDEVIAAMIAEGLVSLQDKTLMLYNER